ELLASTPADGWTGTDARERLLQCCREVMESGVPPTYPPLRDALILFAHLLAAEPGMARLTQAVEAAQLKREQASLSGKTCKSAKGKSKAAALNDSQFCEIRQVRELTTGKKLVILGGDPRREQSRSLQTALQVEGVLWPKMSVHSHAQDYEPAIRKGDLVVVLANFLKIPLKHFREFADRHGARLLRLPQGWSPQQVAHQMIAQWGLTPQAALAGGD
ncbi:MAG TPA: hypothetical protein VK689_10595, partial [Armatimonadota bacterium]|nr:hypothetical protein [Armatimonadota bacterium]